jgi:hypothetical protein
MYIESQIRITIDSGTSTYGLMFIAKYLALLGRYDKVDNLAAVLRIQDPGSGAFFWPRDPEWVKNKDPDPDLG